MKVFGIVLAIAVILGGCKKGGYDANQMAALSEPERKIVGKYKLEFNTSTSSETEEIKKLAEVMDSIRGEITMECLPDKTFTLMTMQVPVKGSWSLNGNLVQLRIDKVGDMRPEEITAARDRNRGVQGWDMNPSQRSEFLQGAANQAALDQAEDLTTLQVGIDSKSLFATKQNGASMFSAGVSVFRQVQE